MRKLIYDAIVSADLYYEGPDGRFDWSVPGPDLHEHINAAQADIDTYVFGRRMYETMQYWDEVNPGDLSPEGTGFANLWETRQKLVASTTLKSVGPGATLIEGDVVEAVRDLKQQSGGSISVGGGTLAAPLIAAGLVDEFSLSVIPVIVGGGKPYWPTGIDLTTLELIEHRTFANSVICLRYHRA